MSVFGRWMKRVRSERGLTQADLTARAVEQLTAGLDGEPPTVSASFISNIENDRRSPSMELAGAIAVALGKPRSMGLFMRGFVPPEWLRVKAPNETEELRTLEALFTDANRMSLGAEVVVRGQGTKRTKMRPATDPEAKTAGEAVDAGS